MKITEQSFQENLAAHEDTLLGMPLATWVERDIVDPLTGYQHSILRDSACQLPPHLHDGFQDQKPNDAISSQISRSLHVYPQARQALQLLLQLHTHGIDMGSLIRVPDELYHSENEWFGNMLSAEKIKKEDSMEVDAQGSASANETTQPKQSNGISNMEQLNRAFSYVTNAILALDKQMREQAEGGEAKMKVDKDDEASPEEDPVLRNIRLNLLALVSAFFSFYQFI